MGVKFAHIADCHLGGWRIPELQEVNIRAFDYTIDFCIRERVNIVLIAGDLLDTSLPNIEIIKKATEKLRHLKEAGIKAYIVPGSHDFSLSGKSMIDVLEKAGLCVNVANNVTLGAQNGSIKLNFHKDEENGLLIAGICGRKGGLEEEVLKNLNVSEAERALEKEDGLKIFLLHTAIKELTTEMPYLEPLSFKDLPKGFHYYAAGHIHTPARLRNGSSLYAYSGVLFPNNFNELVTLEGGSFLLLEFDGKELTHTEEKIVLKKVTFLDIFANNKSSKELESEIIEKITDLELKDKILAIRLKGVLKSGGISDINFQSISELAKEKECYAIVKNVSGLVVKEHKAEMAETKNTVDIEREVIKKYLSVLDKSEIKEKKMIFDLLMVSLALEKLDGERNNDFEKRILEGIFNSKIFNEG
ncbi:MAG: DNA repair exonuclease [Nanoarchaeota archaeon]